MHVWAPRRSAVHRAWNGAPPMFSQFWFAGVLEVFGGRKRGLGRAPNLQEIVAIKIAIGSKGAFEAMPPCRRWEPTTPEDDGEGQVAHCAPTVVQPEILE